MSDINLKRMWILLILAILISSAVLLTDAFRDDNFCHYDSPFYATISQNIVNSGDWLNLRYSLDKPVVADHPPLVFWANALSLKMFGTSVFSVILFSVLCTIGTCIAVFFIGLVLKNDIAGFFSAMGLLLTRYVPRVARYNTIEIPLMFFVTLAILFLILAFKKHRAFYLLFGLSAGLAILSKGVVGMFPLGICFLAIIFQGKLRDFYNPLLLAGIVVSLAMPILWFFLKGGMSLAGAKEALVQYFSFVSSTFQASGRGESTTVLRLITQLFEICFIIIPGVVLGVYFTVRESMREKRKDYFSIFLWIVIFVAAFSISSWRRGFYLLPMYPAMAILFGIGLNEVLPVRYRMYTVYLVIAFFAGNISAPFLFPHWEPKSIGEVVYENTYLPKVKKVINAIFAQSPEKIKLVSYHPKSPKEDEFIFFFRSDYNIELCRSSDEFRQLAVSRVPVLFHISKHDFSQVDKTLHNKLKIIYAYSDQLLVTNDMSLVPVFDIADSK